MAALQVGDRVRVCESVIVYNNPEMRNQSCDLEGWEGEVTALASFWQGEPIITANLPYQVTFTPKFRAHFRDGELEKL